MLTVREPRMILLDTNLGSQPLRPAPYARVIAWIDAQPLKTLFLSASNVAELRLGVALLPAGKRLTLDTRDTGPLQAAGTPVINLWRA